VVVKLQANPHARATEQRFAQRAARVPHRAICVPLDRPLGGCNNTAAAIKQLHYDKNVGLTGDVEAWQVLGVTQPHQERLLALLWERQSDLLLLSGCGTEGATHF
jgi:hypothetical protein